MNKTVALYIRALFGNDKPVQDLLLTKQIVKGGFNQLSSIDCCRNQAPHIKQLILWL